MKKINKLAAAICFSLTLALTAVAGTGSLTIQAATSGNKEVSASAGETEENEKKTEEILIKNVQDFEELMQNCQYDTWSIGKTVRLVSDIDISSLEFEGIAYFSGIFEGDGHTISHVTVKASGSDYGFFRYLGKNAVVNNVKLSGKVSTDGSSERIGGIVGVNNGTVSNCMFTGTVSGKVAVGGIVGENREDGKVMDCTSDATVTATNETGGIVGNNLGLISGCASEGNVNTDELNTTMDLGGVDIGTLNLTKHVVDRNDMGGIAGTSSGIIKECVNHGTIGFSHTGYNAGGIAGRQSGKMIDCTNEGTVYGRKDVGGIVGQAEPYIESEYLDEKVDSAQASVKSINQTLSNMSSTISNTSTEAKTYVDNISNQYKESSKSLSDSLNNLSNAIGDSNPEARQYMDNIEDSLKKIDQIQGNNRVLSKEQSDAIQEQWRVINDNLSNVRGKLSENSDSAEDFLKDVSEQLKEKDTDGNVDKLADTVDHGIQSVTSGIDKISSQLQNIENVIDDTMSVVTGKEDYIEDISSIDSARDTDGVISGSMNRGSINGDLNTGGIVGTMNIEYDIDPEFDADFTESTNIALRSTVNNVVIHCINYGEVTTKKNCVGGIAGLQELGLIYGCESYGTVKANTGSYAGGIAGESASAISDSYSLCNVKGQDYVGGIAGTGYTLRNSISAATITGEGEGLGSIAGTVANEGEVKNNRFVNDEIDGIDNINYTGVADKVSYEEIMSLEQIPDGFKRVTVTFKADGQIVTEKTVAYNGSLTETELPPIPEKDGYYANWPKDITGTAITENKTVEAEYTLWTESIAGEKRAKNSKALFLVEGKFYQDTALEMEVCDTSSLNGNIVYAYRWSLSNTQDKKYDKITGHFYVTEETGKNELWYQEKDSSWKKAETTESGSYLIAEIPYGAAFALVHTDADYTTYYMAGGATVIILLLLLLKKKRRNRKAKKKGTFDATADAVE